MLTGEPVLLEYDGRKGPKWKTLEKNKVKLKDDERSEILRRDAAWHPSGGPHKGKAVPAVWKAVVNGKPWFVTHTHRAYNVCPTLAGACNRFHRFIKSTS